MKKILLFVILAVFLMAGNSWALSLTLESGDVQQVVTDSDLDGLVFFTGSVGGWNINYTLGVGYPSQIGTQPSMHLNSFNATSSGTSADLTILLSDIFEADVNGIVFDVGGLIDSSMTAEYNLYLNDESIPIATIGSFSNINGYFGGSDVVYFDNLLTGQYTLTMEVIISSSTKGSMSFDAEINPVPEPATMLLLGSGLIGLAGFGRKRFSQKG